MKESVFCFTGELDNWTRTEAVKELTALGASYQGTVSKKTTHVVVGKEPGKKLQQALKYGCKILYEPDFLATLRSGTIPEQSGEPGRQVSVSIHHSTLPKRRAFILEMELV